MNDNPNPFAAGLSLEDDGLAGTSAHPNVTPLSLRLVAKKVPIRFAEFRISNQGPKMLSGESHSLSPYGIQFAAPVPFPKSALMRVWIEMPDYWARKSRHVGYRHTDAPTYFQLLARVANCEETGKRGAKYQILCQTVNLDPIDELVLNDYLGLGAQGT